MRIAFILGLITSFQFAFGQTDSITLKAQPNAFVAIDLFGPINGIITDRNAYSIGISYPITKKFHLAADIGYESNHYDEINWDVDVNGLFAKLGGQYFLSQDDLNPNMGYYVGGKIGYTPFNQTVNSFIIRGNQGYNLTSSLPEHSAMALWIEPLAGGRVQIAESPFYIDASVQLKIKLYSDNDEGLEPLVIPGYGEDKNGLSIGLNWSIGYAINM